jgi:hypothetical protein
MDPFILRRISEAEFQKNVKACRDQEHQLYLLLDGGKPANQADIPKIPEDRVWLLEDSRFERMIGDGPMVFSLPAETPWNLWLQSGGIEDAACVISVSCPKEKVIPHLKRLTTATVPGGTKEMLFRFHDPRNMATLLESFTPEEKKAFFGPVRSLWWFTAELPARRDEASEHPRGGNAPSWHTVENPNPEAGRQHGPWPMSSATLEALREHMSGRIVLQVYHRVRNYVDCRREMALLGKTGAVALVGLAVKQAKEHGVTHSNEYAQRAKWLLRLGENFERDPQYPWVTMQPQNESLEERWDRFHTMAEEAHEIIHSNNHRSYEYFVKRLWNVQYDDIRFIDTEEDVLRSLSLLWPERYEAFDEKGMKAMISRAREDAIAWGMEEPYGTTILSGLYFICGVDALTSPIRYPWLRFTKDHMLKESAGKRSAWFFSQLRPWIRALYRPFGRGVREQRRQVRDFARKRCLRRILTLEMTDLADIMKRNSLLQFYEWLYPEMYRRVNPQKRSAAARSSVRYTEQLCKRYNIMQVAPLVAFVAFAYMAGMRKYPSEVGEEDGVHVIFRENGITRTGHSARPAAVLALIKRGCRTELNHTNLCLPDEDIFKNIFMRKV